MYQLRRSAIHAERFFLYRNKVSYKVKKDFHPHKNIRTKANAVRVTTLLHRQLTLPASAATFSSYSSKIYSGDK
jgi:hypothetical protein